MPGAPRIACEAGYVAHLADREEDAAARIGAALRLFGAPDRVPDDLRVPLAMCLYNHGLVLEATGDRAGAIASYDRSLAIRPNATVRARRAALGDAAPAAAAAEPDVRVTGTGGVVLAETRDLGALARRLGEPTDDGGRAPARQLASADLPGGAHAYVFETFVDEELFSTVRYTLAVDTAEGFALRSAGVGAIDHTDHGATQSSGASPPTLRVEEGVLRIEWRSTSSDGGGEDLYEWEGHEDVECFVEWSSGDVAIDVTALCSIPALAETGPSGARACVTDHRSARIASPGSREITCEGDESPPAVPAPPPIDEEYEVSIEVLPGDRVRIERARGTPPEGLEPGERGRAELPSLDADLAF
jgi:hypothetical protein